MNKPMMMILVLMSSMSFAGTNRVGNGGDVFVCHDILAKSPFKKSKKVKSVTRTALPIQTVELLDFMESEVPMSKFQGDYNAILSQVLENLTKVAPQLASQYSKRLESIREEIYFQDHSLKDIQDSSEWIERKNCQLIQAAIRKNDVSFGEKRFVIQKTLWEKMDDRNKAGLMMHEIVYEHFFKLGEVNSVKARKVNALLFSSEITKMTTTQFYKNLQKMDLPIYQR